MQLNYTFRRTLSAFILLLASTLSWAYDFEAGGIYYNINADKTSVEVTYEKSLYENDSYSGDLVIPSTVSYGGKTFNVTGIGDEAFRGCFSLTSIVIPDGVTGIGEAAFKRCTSLTSVIIGYGVASIGYNAFGACSSLTTINIPASVVSIGDKAFSDCSSLAAIDIPEGVVSIEDKAFGGCSSLIAINIPASVTSIGESILRDCSSIESITVSADNPVYDSREGCNAIIETSTNTLIAGVKSTIIPAGVTGIGNSAFSYCSSLTVIDIPDGVTSIGDDAFTNCTSLTSIDIPGSVTSIGDWVFDYCYSLASVICRAGTVPNTVYFTFGTISLSEATLYVPESALEAYKAAEQWKSFGTILPIEGNEDVIDGINSPSARRNKAADAVYYTLDGKQTTAPVSGSIYISGGKQVLY